MCFPRVLLAFSGLFLASIAWAQDVPSGPDQGKNVPVFVATGPNKDKEIDYAAERKQKPTIYLFIQADKWGRPMARFLRKLDQVLQKANDDAVLVAVWLTDDPERTKDYLPVAQEALLLQKTILACFTGDKAGLEEWNMNGDASLTAVVATKGNVASTIGYRSINETDAAAVLAAYEKALKDR
jgi:hypothetical protein